MVKIKVIMSEFFSDAQPLPSWFKHHEMAEITWDQLQELHEAGLDIMLKKKNKAKNEKEDGVYILGVSRSGFSAR